MPNNFNNENKYRSLCLTLSPIHPNSILPLSPNADAHCRNRRGISTLISIVRNVKFVRVKYPYEIERVTKEMNDTAPKGNRTRIML